jgi:hypothetical protein
MGIEIKEIAQIKSASRKARAYSNASPSQTKCKSCQMWRVALTCALCALAATLVFEFL